MKPGELVDTSFHQQISLLASKKKNLIKRINQNIQQIKS
jgi:hypothetical protein